MRISKDWMGLPIQSFFYFNIMDIKHIASHELSLFDLDDIRQLRLWESDLISIIKVAKATGNCPRWFRVLLEVVDGNTDNICTLNMSELYQLCYNYSAICHIRHTTLFNTKRTTKTKVKKIIRDYILSIDRDILDILSVLYYGELKILSKYLKIDRTTFRYFDGQATSILQKAHQEFGMIGWRDRVCLECALDTFVYHIQLNNNLLIPSIRKFNAVWNKTKNLLKKYLPLVSPTELTAILSSMLRKETLYPSKSPVDAIISCIIIDILASQIFNCRPEPLSSFYTDNDSLLLGISNLVTQTQRLLIEPVHNNPRVKGDIPADFVNKSLLLIPWYDFSVLELAGSHHSNFEDVCSIASGNFIYNIKPDIPIYFTWDIGRHYYNNNKPHVYVNFNRFDCGSIAAFIPNLDEKLFFHNVCNIIY